MYGQNNDNYRGICQRLFKSCYIEQYDSYFMHFLLTVSLVLLTCNFSVKAVMKYIKRQESCVNLHVCPLDMSKDVY